MCLEPSHYHLFRSLQNFLDGKKLDDWIATDQIDLTKFFTDKREKLYASGIMKLPQQ